MSDLGSMRMENEESEPALVVPVIPVRPNPTIPVLIGVLLLITSVVLIMEGTSSILMQGEANLGESEVAQLEQGLKQANVTAADIQEMHDDLRHAKYYWYQGWGFVIGGLLMVGGAVQLLRKRSVGAKLGMAGNGMILIAAVSGYNLSSEAVSNHGELLSMTYAGMAFVYGICAVCCGLFAAFPMIHGAGRASLDTHLDSSPVGGLIENVLITAASSEE